MAGAAPLLHATILKTFTTIGRLPRCPLLLPVLVRLITLPNKAKVNIGELKRQDVLFIIVNLFFVEGFRSELRTQKSPH